MRAQFDFSLDEIQQIIAKHIREDHSLRNYDIKFDWSDKPAIDGVTCECTENEELKANRLSITGGRKFPDFNVKDEYPEGNREAEKAHVEKWGGTD